MSDRRGSRSVPPNDDERRPSTAASSPGDISLGRALWRLYAYWWLAGTRLSVRMLVGLWPLFLLLATFQAGVEWAPASAGREFFSAAAQVIPVLLLALAVESRMFRLRRFTRHPTELTLSEPAQEAWRVVQRRAPPLAALLGVLANGSKPIMRHQTLIIGVLYGGALLFLLVIAEWHCLSVLASITEEQTHDPSLVSAAILSGLVGVGIIALVGAGEDDAEATGRPSELG